MLWCGISEQLSLLGEGSVFAAGLRARTCSGVVFPPNVPKSDFVDLRQNCCGGKHVFLELARGKKYILE